MNINELKKTQVNTFITTVADKKSHYSRTDYSKDVHARHIQRILGRHSTGH